MPFVSAGSAVLAENASISSFRLTRLTLDKHLVVGWSITIAAVHTPPWTRNAGSECTEGGASSKTALHSEPVPSCSDIDPQWSPSRVPVGENCCLKMRSE